MKQEFLRCHDLLAKNTCRLVDLLCEAESRGYLLEDALTIVDTAHWLQVIDWQSKFLSVVLGFTKDPSRKSQARRSRAAAAEASASLPWGVCAESQAQAGRHGARDREHRQAVQGRCRRAWGQCPRDGWLLRHSRKTPLARHLPDCVGEADGPGGGGVSARVPSLRRRHPADLVYHGAGGDGRQEPAHFEPEVRKRAMATMALPA